MSGSPFASCNPTKHYDGNALRSKKYQKCLKLTSRYKVIVL